MTEQNEDEKYWGCVFEPSNHVKERMNAAREYSKMVSDDKDTPQDRADRASTFELGAMWENGWFMEKAEEFLRNFEPCNYVGTIYSDLVYGDYDTINRERLINDFKKFVEDYDSRTN